MRKGLPLTQGIKSGCDKNDIGFNFESGDKIFQIFLKTGIDNRHELETGGDQWHAGVALSNYLVLNPHLIRNKRCLELGSGLGLVGLTAAALGASKVVFTDLESQTRIILANINFNRRSVEACECIVATHIFGDCCGASYLAETHQVEVVLGSDIGYDLSLLELLNASTQTFATFPLFNMALLAEEVRWNDVYTWYKESLATSASHTSRDLLLTETNINYGTKNNDVCVSLFRCDLENIQESTVSVKCMEQSQQSISKELVSGNLDQSVHPIQLILLSKVE